MVVKAGGIETSRRTKIKEKIKRMKRTRLCQPWESKETAASSIVSNVETPNISQESARRQDRSDPVDESEIYSDKSDEDMTGGAYGGYAAELTEGDMPVDSEEYLLDDSTDSELCYDYRNRFTPTNTPTSEATGWGNGIQSNIR